MVGDVRMNSATFLFHRVIGNQRLLMVGLGACCHHLVQSPTSPFHPKKKGAGSSSPPSQLTPKKKKKAAVASLGRHLSTHPSLLFSPLAAPTWENFPAGHSILVRNFFSTSSPPSPSECEIFSFLLHRLASSTFSASSSSVLKGISSVIIIV